MVHEFANYFQNAKQYIISHSPSLIVGVVLLILFILLGRFFRFYVRNRLIHKIDDQLLVNFIGRAIFLLMLIFGLVIFFNQVGLGKAAGGILAGAGVSAIILGFAFKDIGENFLAGFFLAFSRPFGIGDVIETEALLGKVKALNFRNTHIRTFDGKDIYLPNALLIKKPLINYTRDGLLRYDFLLGLDYGDHMQKVIDLIYGTLQKEEAILHESGHKPVILLEEFGTSTINLRVYYWINSGHFSGDMAQMRTEIMNNILVALIREGFNLPADIVELKIYQEGKPIPVRVDTSDHN